ncbi:MAG: PaaI family thioesterase [Parasphingopyxis sp.]|nr:PaaI family thioesterase [Sphingomonadales bacterium]
MSDTPEEMRKQMIGGDFDPRGFIELMASHSHGGLIGTRYLDHGDDWAELAIDYDEKLVGDPATGILASGPVVSLVDTASGMAIWLKSQKFVEIVTIDLRVDYLRPAKVGNSVCARMQCYRATRNIAFVRGQAHDGDAEDPIAQAAGTFMFMRPA